MMRSADFPRAREDYFVFAYDCSAAHGMYADFVSALSDNALPAVTFNEVKESVDVIIDFSSPAVLKDELAWAQKRNIPVVLASTICL